jgi:hypothetical protein
MPEWNGLPLLLNSIVFTTFLASFKHPKPMQALRIIQPQQPGLRCALWGGMYFKVTASIPFLKNGALPFRSLCIVRSSLVPASCNMLVQLAHTTMLVHFCFFTVCDLPFPSLQA